VMPEPIGEPVAEHSAQRGGKPNRPEADSGRANQPAEAEKNDGGRQQKRDER
jgi:hypothetical protein